MGTKGFFNVGDRCENRLGWYTVVRIDQGAVTIRYDSGTGATVDDLALLQRIIIRLGAKKKGQ